MHRSIVLPFILCALTAAAQDAPKPQFTARELFYSAASDQAPPVKPAPKPATTPAPKPAVAPKKPATPPPVPVQTATTPTPSQPPQQPPSQPAEPAARPDDARVYKAALVTAPAPDTGTPLGLKYTILRKSGDDMVDVPPDTVFHDGDRIQLRIQTNGPGYLYIVNRGSSGTWAPMFPSPEVADGDNRVDGWTARVFPPQSRMVLNAPTGTERLFVVFSRTPEDGLENMIYSLQDGKPKPAADQSKPDKAPPDKPVKKYVLSASADIPDSTVGQLRDTYTRDLIIEKVDDKTPSDKSMQDKQEKATYVVNPSGSSDSRVVASIDLVHQ
jgi:hypothetical protein